MSETSMTAGFYHIPDEMGGNDSWEGHPRGVPLFPSSPRQLDDRGNRAPVALAVGDEVEVRRAPVLDQRGPGVPARPSVHLLDIATALAAGGHQVALLAGLLRRQPYLVGGALDAAERAAELGEGPGATAEMTGQ